MCPKLLAGTWSIRKTNMSGSDEDLANELLDLVAREGMVDRAALKPESVLDELDIISADFIMILMAIEEEYGAYISVDSELTDVTTVADLLSIATAKINEHRAANPA